jgi:hypothetical protein
MPFLLRVIPRPRLFLAMVTNPNYQKAIINPQVGVPTSRLIRMAEVGFEAAYS